MNLAKKSVWCEICNRPIVLEQNYPQFRFKTRNKQLAEASDGRLIYESTTSGHLDAQSIMFDRAFEHHALATSSQSSECTNMGDYGLVEFLEQDIDPNREAYDKSFADDSSDKLRDAYEDLPVRNGLIGLDNLGNTCYMNSALQALSNCLAFTSFFLECSQFIESIIPNNSGVSGATLTAASSSTNNTACLSISYMKLMREIWQKRNSKNKRQMASSISPSELVQTIKYFNAMFRGYSQHDSQEFILYLLDQLHEEMKRPLIPVLLSKNNDQKKPADNEEEEEEEGDEEDGSEGNDSNADEDDRTVIQQGDQQQLKVARSDSSTLNDSVSKRPRKKSHHHHHHHHHGHHGNHGNHATESNGINLNESSSDHAVDSDESDSYETCGGGESAATSSELSDKLHFSDVEESPHSSMSFDCPADDQASSSIADAQSVRASRSDHEAAEKEDTRQLLDKLSEYRKNRLSNTNTNSSVSNITDTTDSGISTVHSQDSSMASKEKAKKTNGPKNNSKSTSKTKKNGDQPQQPPKPDYSSIVSDLFNGQIIGQVQCLECKHLSTTTETFQHLSLPIPSKEYLQALHSKVVNHQNLRSNGSNDGDEENDDSSSRRGAEGSDEMSSSVPYQSWLSWMVDVMKGYIWVRKTAEALA